MPGRPGKCLLSCAGALALGLAGCGGDEPERTIPASSAEMMISRLEAIEASAEAGDCEIVTGSANALEDLIFNLPSEVGAETKEALREAADNATELALERCSRGTTGESGAEETTTDSDAESTAPPTTDTDETDTGETETDQTETQPDEPPADTGEPSGNSGSGGGGSGGGPSGGGSSGTGGGDTDVGGSGEVTPDSGGVSPEGG